MEEIVERDDQPVAVGQVAEVDAAPEAPTSTDEVVRLARIVESVLFAAAAPVSLRRLVEILDGPSSRQVQAVMTLLRQDYGPGVRGIQLHEVAGGYQLRTARENAEWVRAIFRDKPLRVGRAALETLAVIAYKQPVTKAEIEAIRGVDVDGTLTTLLARRLIKIAGRKEAVGRPLLYTTTPEFLEAFGLKDLEGLPSLKELGGAAEGEDVEATFEPPTNADAAGAASEPGASTADGQDGAHANCVRTAAAGEEAAAEAAAAEAAVGGAATEDSEPGGDRLASQGRGADPGGPSAGERPRGDGAGDEGESEDGSHHD
jgi:segregation and condensation protein B